MIDIANDIQSLTDFKRRTNQFVEKMRETGHPLVLTVNGKAQLVVQDAEAYQKLLEAIDYADAVKAICRGMESGDRGKGRPMREAAEAIRRKHKIPRKAPRRASRG